jgi:putative membrane protein
MPALFAILHHLAAFAMVAALVLELARIREPLSLAVARRLQAADRIYGLSAAVLLAVGLLRVFHFEKGAAFYFSNGFFIAKLTLFVVAALLSIVPTLEFASWRRAVRQGEAPVVGEGRLRTLRRLIQLQLAAVALIIVCAALMARGIGSW